MAGEPQPPYSRLSPRLERDIHRINFYRFCQLLEKARPDAPPLGSTLNPAGVSTSCSRRRLSGMSSTTSTRTGALPGASLAWARLSARVRGCSGSVACPPGRGSCTWKQVPWPGVLRSWMVPPIRCSRRWLMLRPSPVPPPDLRPASACWKGWNSSAWSAWLMPGPVSSTSSHTWAGCPKPGPPAG